MTNDSERELKKSGITAWHGASAEFDKFSTEFISGGEGVQAYGWGMYFATSREVAKWYRNVLDGNQSGIWVGEKYIPKVDQGDIKEKNQRYIDYTAAFFLENMGYEGATNRVHNDLEQKRQLMKIPGLVKHSQSEIVVYRAILDRIENWKNKPIRLEEGRMYEVALSPTEMEYLDWDATSVNQSEEVKSVLRREKLVYDAETKGKDIYENMVTEIQQEINVLQHPAAQSLNKNGHLVEEYTAEEITSKYFNSIGIPGLKFFDKNSRSQGLGTTNYVVFDEKNVSVTARYKRKKIDERFYSPLEKVFEEKLPNRGTPESYKRTIEGLLRKGHVKKEEVEWYGIIPLLEDLKDSEPQQRVSKEELIDFIHHHQIEVIDIVKGEYPNDKEEWFRYALADKLIEILGESGGCSIATSNAIQQWRDNQGTWDELDAETIIDKALSENKNITFTFDEIKEEIKEEVSSNETQYSSYRAIEGGTNYREILLTVPDLQKSLSDIETMEYSRALSDLRDAKKEINFIRTALRQLTSGTIDSIPVRETEYSWALNISVDQSHWAGSTQPPIYVGKGVVRTENAAKEYLQKLIQNSNYEENTTSEMKAINIKIEEIVSRLDGNVGEYKTSHWDDVTNVLAHVRFDDQIGGDGKRTLMIHEIQSDWHQAGRKNGYQTSDPEELISRHKKEFDKQYKYAKSNISEGRFASAVARVEMKTLHKGSRFEHEQYDAILNGISIGTFGDLEKANDEIAKACARRHPKVIAAKQEGDKSARKVPDAPFKKTWPLLSVKFLLNYVVEQGYDHVAWASGQMVADMFDLSCHISEIQYDPDEQVLSGWNRDGEQVLDENEVTAEQFPEHIGKELSVKLEQEIQYYLSRENENEIPYGKEERDYVEYESMPNVSGEIVNTKRIDSSVEGLPTIKGLDVSIGGEGMVKFYDDILPSIVGKYTNSLGGKFKKNDSQTEKNIHIIDITSELRARVMQGQPLFRRGRKECQCIKKDEVEKTLTPIVSEIGIPVCVVQSATELPARLIRIMIRDNAIDDTSGVYDRMTGQAYLIADNIRSPKEAVVSYLHEIKGHASFRAAVGGKLNNVLDQIYKDLPQGTITGLYNENSSQLHNLDTIERRRVIAEEWVAGIAETNPRNTWVQKIVSTIKDWLRKIKPDISFSREDIVELLSKGMRSLRREHIRVPENCVAEATIVEVSGSTFGNRKESAINDICKDGIEVVISHPTKYSSETELESEVSIILNKGKRSGDATIYNINNNECFEKIFSPEDSGLGAPLYQALFAWAHSHDKRLVMDPDGITDLNILRRAEGAISSALQHETTRHIEIYPETYIALLNNKDYLEIMEYRKKVRGLGCDAEIADVVQPPTESYDRLHILYGKMWKSEDGGSMDTFNHNLRGVLEAIRAMVIKKIPALDDYYINEDDVIIDRRSGHEVNKQNLPVSPELGVSLSTAMCAIMMSKNQYSLNPGKGSEKEIGENSDRQLGPALLNNKRSNKLYSELEGLRNGNSEPTLFTIGKMRI